jgi:NAD(P)-dependent dehydrogenase (short-subunit alcohol dehydrogenase family)
MATYLITGSSRGIGYNLVEKIVATKPGSEVSKVFASARSETPAIKKLVAGSNGRIEFVQLDITSLDSIKAAAAQVEKSLDGKGLDVLINNAGVLNTDNGNVEVMTDLASTFDINVVGPHNVSATFLPLLRKGSKKQIINVSSTVGSISLQSFLKHLKTPAYKVSKAALNMLTVQYAQDYADEGFTVVTISPGYIKTELVGDEADLTIEEGTTAAMELIFSITKEDNGKFRNIYLPDFKNKYGFAPYDEANLNPPW